MRRDFHDERVYIIDKQDRVHMAHIDIHFGYAVNGVAALHTEILKESELKPFYDIYPEKFNNKTNGITFRRWLLHCNQELSAYIAVSYTHLDVYKRQPYTLLQLTGVIQNIPAELYEAAKVDGANAVQRFFKITLPYMLYVTTPYLIVTFTGNVNNFNIIYLLSGGDPVTDLSSAARCV